jgi:hypothetical protein
VLRRRCRSRRSRIALGPAIALRAQPVQLLAARGHEIGAVGIHLQDQHVADVLAQAFGEVARIEALLERAMERAQRFPGIAAHDRVRDVEERLAIGEPEHAAHERLVDLALARRHDLIERAHRRRASSLPTCAR